MNLRVGADEEIGQHPSGSASPLQVACKMTAGQKRRFPAAGHKVDGQSLKHLLELGIGRKRGPNLGENALARDYTPLSTDTPKCFNGSAGMECVVGDEIEDY